MTIPATAKKFEAPMDPSDVVKYFVDLTELLADGEEFTSVDISVVAESAFLGFQIRTEPPYAPVEVENGKIIVWASVDEAKQGDSSWLAGTLCGIEFTAITNSTPPSTYQRTATVQVVQQ